MPGIDGALEIRLLASPEVVVAGDVRPVARSREQAILVRLALASPNPVPVEAIVDDVWGDEPPARAVDAVRVHVSNLRKLLAGPAFAGTDVLRTTPRGYRLDVPPGATDVGALEEAVRSRRVDELRAALASWPDDDLGRFDAGTGWFLAASRRVGELRFAAVEALADALLDAGCARDAVALLEDAVGRDRHREALWQRLVVALDRADRRADALRAYQRAREALADVGMAPGPGLVAAEAAVLTDRGAPRERRPATDDVVVDGSRIVFATFGTQRSDLLFLHGGFVPFDVMRETPRLARFIDELATRFRVVFVDRRGIGMSDPPVDGAPVTIDHWVSDCRAVLEAVGSRDAVVLGHEHGGPVAIRLAAELPATVTGLVLHSTAARPLRAPDHPFGPGTDAIERIDRMIDRLPGTTDALALVAPSAGDDADLRAWLERAGRLGAGPARARELHRAYLHCDVRAALPAVRAPAVVLHPARMIRTDAGQARYLADHLPDAELQLLDSADHLFWLADAEAVLAALDRLRARIASQRPRRARLRAIVVVAPAGAADALAVHGPETLTEIDGCRVASFTTLAAAHEAVAAVTAAAPSARVAVDVADTTGASDDPALRALVRALASA